MKLPKRSEKLIMPNLIKIKDLLNEKMLPDQREVEILLAHILQKPREFILAHPEHTVDKIQIKKYKQLIAKRLKNIPIAYLTGHKEFFRLDFLVNKNVLIPRPDTELMVEEVLKELGTRNSEIKTILIDVGTGSGCIPISIARHCEWLKTTKQSQDNSKRLLRRSAPRNDINFFAIDISPQTLTVARKNAHIHKTKIKILQGNLLEPLIKNSKIPKLQNYKIIITANLPYLTPQQLRQEPSIQHEPKLALIAGRDGLKYYRELLNQISSFHVPHSTFLFLEIDPSQTYSIKKLIKKTLPQAKIEIKQDLAGLNRIVIIKFNQIKSKSLFIC